METDGIWLSLCSFAEVPFKYIPPDVAGLAAIPSFGVGALLAGVLVTLG